MSTSENSVQPEIHCIETIPSKGASKLNYSQAEALCKDVETLFVQTKESASVAKVNEEIVEGDNASDAVGKLIQASGFEKTIRIVHRKLQQKYGMDYSERKKVMREAISSLLDAHFMEIVAEAKLEADANHTVDPEEK